MTAATTTATTIHVTEIGMRNGTKIAVRPDFVGRLP
jgi:hypothetical protein